MMSVTGGDRLTGVTAGGDRQFVEQAMSRRIKLANLNWAIRMVVEQVGDPLMEHIIERVTKAYPGIWTAAEIKTEVLAMVNRGELRQKEDEVDHDWAYRKGRNWG